MAISFLAAMQMRSHDLENLLQDDLENLLQASFCGDATTLKALLLRGVSAESCGPGGHLALPLACAGGHSACAHMLLLAGADVSAGGVSGATPLFAAVAATGGDAACAAVLLQHGAHVDAGREATDDEAAHSPLQVASALGHSACVELLLAHGASADVSDENGVNGIGLNLNFY